MHGDAGELARLLTLGFPVDTPHPLRQTTALIEAIRQGQREAANYLIEYGADCEKICGVRTTTALHLAIKQEFFDIADLLVPQLSHTSALDANGRSVLHMLSQTKACQKPSTAIIALAKIIIQKGVSLNTPDHEGISALHYAVIHECQKFAEILLQAGANPNIAAQDTGVTPLMIANIEKQTDMQTLLKRYGATLNA
jgi:ankyrin repeat protein